MIKEEVFIYENESLRCTHNDCQDRTQQIVAVVLIKSGDDSMVLFACSHCLPDLKAKIEKNFDRMVFPPRGDN